MLRLKPLLPMVLIWIKPACVWEVWDSQTALADSSWVRTGEKRTVWLSLEPQLSSLLEPPFSRQWLTVRELCFFLQWCALFSPCFSLIFCSAFGRIQIHCPVAEATAVIYCVDETITEANDCSSATRAEYPRLYRCSLSLFFSFKAYLNSKQRCSGMISTSPKNSAHLGLTKE